MSDVDNSMLTANRKFAELAAGSRSSGVDVATSENANKSIRVASAHGCEATAAETDGVEYKTGVAVAAVASQP